ncbi:Gfo/Idh/MocA family oxidoreductase [Paenibacillus sp. IHBB 3054]|uniref:Gfo/Idh/MocA family oxidoreductase n=1 Tax=Paenibacillus sp. IHBB 3054 TaxID=3425689 RepID=UPI003F663F35
MSIQKNSDRKNLDQRLHLMPWFVQQFIDYKRPDLSPSTLLEYIRDYESFFGWLRVEGLSTAGSNAEITLLDLETLHMDSIVGYRLHLTTRAEGTNTRVTVSRKLSALRSLFHYLSQIAEDEDFYPLLKRNIMAKVEIKRIHKPKDTAAKLKGKILEDEELLEFVDRVVVFGRNEAKLLKLREELGVEITMSIEDIMSDPGMDVIDICLPYALHKTYAVEAMRCGKHVFCETPVALESEDVQAMLHAEQQYGRRILVNQFIKLDYAYEYLYKAVQEASYGKLLHVTLRRETAPLWGDLGLSMIAANLMIHDLDFIAWLLDSPAPSAVWGTTGGNEGQALVHAPSFNLR